MSQKDKLPVHCWWTHDSEQWKQTAIHGLSIIILVHSSLTSTMHVAWQLHDLFEKSRLSHNVTRSNSRMGNQQLFWMWQWLKQAKDEAPVIFWLCLQFCSVYWYKFIFAFTAYTIKLLYKLWNLYINISWYYNVRHSSKNSLPLPFNFLTIQYCTGT